MSDMPSMLPSFGWQSFLGSWHGRPAWDVVAVLLLAGYGVGLFVCRRHGVRPVNGARIASFVGGVVLLVLTVSASVDVYAMAIFWDHMIEHLLLIMVVPALLVLGHPLTVLRAAAAVRGREAAVDRLLRCAPVALVTHPLVAMAVYSIVIVTTHLTSFMDAMARHTWLMGAEQVVYLVSGYLFLLPLIGSEPIRWKLPNLARVGLVLLAMTPDTVVGITLMQTNHDLFPVMEAAHPSWAPSPVQDLNIAGALMWAGGDGLMMVLGVGVIVALIGHQAPEAVLGRRLEAVRRQALTAHVSRGDTEPTEFDENADLDEDEAMLAAYNRMLGRLDRGA